jgi:hypothetical protein
MLPMIPYVADVQMVGVHVSHSDGSRSRSFTLPARSLILDAFAVCTESAAGSPSMDFGTDSDPDGLFSGLGESGICDVAADNLEDVDEYAGRGDFIVSGNNAEDLRVKATKFNAAATTYFNTQSSEGTAGEWDLYILYVVLHSIG